MTLLIPNDLSLLMVKLSIFNFQIPRKKMRFESILVNRILSDKNK